VRFGRPRGGATPEALEELYRARFRAFLNVAASIAGERHAADAVHNAFVRALRHRESFREGGSLEAWVWRTVVNAARDVRGADSDELRLDHRDEPASNGHPPTRDVSVRGVIVALPPRQRLTVFFRYYADLDYATIAEVLDLSPGTVGATLHKAHGAIRRRLQEEGAPCRTS
jgi:RNA polymerase sigma factor (sigma-70 family)